MAKYSHTVDYNIKTTLDSSGLVKLQTQIRQVENNLHQMSAEKLISQSSYQDAIGKIEKIQAALKNSFNSRLGMMDTKKLTTELNNTVGGINQAYAALAKGGAQGRMAFNSLYGQLTKVDSGLKQISSTSDKIINTLGNTVRWGLIASAFSRVMNAAHESVDYVKELDKSLTNIMMVSGASRDNMNEFAREANKVAERLGATTTQMTEATKVFIQQGMNQQQSLAMGEYAVHLANISEQDSATTSDELTAMKNAFKINIDDMGNAISKWAVIANNTAVDMEELSVASQKAASVANTVGVDMEQFAGHIAAIESTTREAPENIGNGLKTLYSRFADIKLGETLEDGVDLGQFSSALKKVGVDVLDTSGKMRDVGTIIEDLMQKWGELDQTERNAVATTVAGRFQLARFEALMNSQDIYKNAVNVSRAETGTTTYDRMQEDYRNSLEGRSKALTAAIEDIFLKAFNTDSFYGLVDAATALTKTFSDLIEAIGGGGAALTALAAILTNTFSVQIGRGIGNFIANRETKKFTAEQRRSIAEEATKGEFAKRGVPHTGYNETTNAAIEDITRLNMRRSIMSPEDDRVVNEMIEERLGLLNREIQAYDTLEKQIMAANFAAQEEGKSVQNINQLLTYMRQYTAKGFSAMTSNDLQKGGFFGQMTEVEALQSQIASKKHLYAPSNKVVNRKAYVDYQKGGYTKLIDDLRATENAAWMTEEKLKQLGNAYKLLERATKAPTLTIEKFYEILERFEPILAETDRQLMEMSEGFELTGSSAQEAAIQVEHATNALNASSGAMNKKAEDLETKNTATELTNFASGIMNVAFAIQSFSNIPNIIENEDLTLFEKFTEITMSASMGLMMLIPGIDAVSKGYKGLKVAIIEWTVAQNASAIATESVTAATTALTVVQALNNTTLGKYVIKLAAAIAGVMGLTGAQTLLDIANKKVAISALTAEAAMAPLIALAVPLIAVVAAIGLVVAGINAASEAAERRKQILEEMTEASNESVRAIKENKESVDSLYESYKITGEASDEFKDALLKQAEALGIVNAEQMIALGQYDQLKEKIDEATQKQLAYNTALMQAAQQNEIQSMAGGWDTWDVTQVAGLSDGLSFEAAHGAGIEYGALEPVPFLRSLPGLVSDDERKERILKVDAAYQKQAETIARLNTEYQQLLHNKASEQVLNAKKAEIDEATNLQNEYKSVLSDENAQKFLEHNKQIIDNQRMMALNNEGMLSTLGSAEDVRALLESGSLGREITEYFKTLGPDAADAYVASFVDDIVNGDAKTALTENMGKALSAASVAAQEYATNQEKAGGDFDSSYKEMMGMLDSVDLSEGAKIKLIGTLDMTKSKEEIQEELNNLTEEDAIKLQLRADIEETKNNLAAALQAIAEDETLGKVQLQNLFPENIVQAFEGAAGQSTAFADAMTLLADNSYATQQNLITLDATLEDLEHSITFSDLIEEAEDAREAIENLDDNALHLADTLEDKAFNLSIDIGGDFIDQADAMTEAMGDISEATSKIGEGFVVAAEDAKLLEHAFPGILENYQITTDGMIQLDQEKAQSAMGLATTELETSTEAQAGKLNAYANYADAMAEAYMQEAAAMAEKAQSDVDLETAKNQYILDSENALQQASAQLMQEHDVAALTVAQNEANYMTEAAQGIADSQAQASGSAGISLAGIATAAWNAASSIAHNFVQVAKTIGYALAGKEYSPSFSSISGGVGSTAASISSKTIGKGSAINIGGRNYTVGNGEGSVALANKAAEYQAKALALRSAAGTARASAAQLQAGSQKANSDMGNAGSPKSSGGNKGGGDSGEEAKNTSYSDIQTDELDIYKKIDAWTEKLTDNYSKLKKVRDKTWSKDKLAIMNKELGNLKTQHKAIQDRIKISKEYIRVLTNGSKAEKETYGIKNTLADLGLTDKDLDGVVDNYREQWQEATKQANQWKAEADAYYAAHGGEIDRFGNVIKEAQMLQDEQQEYQNMVDTANNYLNIAEQINDVTSKYEDSWNEIRDDEEKALDILYEMVDIQVEAYENSIDQLEVLRDARDVMKEMNGLWSGFAQESPFRAIVEDVQEVKDLFENPEYDPIAYYDNIINTLKDRQAKTTDAIEKASYMEAIKWYQNQKSYTVNNKDRLGTGELAQASRRLSELQRWMSNPYSIDNPYAAYDVTTKQWAVDTEALAEEFKKVFQEVTELTLEAEKAWNQVQDDIIEALDKEKEKLDEIYEKYERVNKELEREADRVSLLYGEDQYADLNKLADKQGKVNLEKSKKYYKEYNYWKAKQDAIAEEEENERNRRINEAKLAVERASDAQEKREAELLLEQAKQYHSDEWEWYETRMAEALENTKEAQDEAAEAFKKAYEYAIDELEAQWLESALGTRDSNYLLDDWNRDKDYMTTYKDDFERQYEIQKLNHKWQEMLNDSLGSSLAIQRKIKTEGQEILDQLAGQTTMSEYDVKLANAKLEVLQKQIALENAQQNKNQMKLRRDSQGNYKYIYAANQDDINGKQQELLDSIYDVWEISKNQSIDSTTNYIEAVQQAGEQAKAIWNDASLTIEQKQALIAELMADTGRLLEAISEDAGDSFNGMISAVVLGSGIGLENVQEMCANVLEALETRNEEAIEAIGVPWDDELQSKMENIDQVEYAFSTMMDNCANANRYFLDEIQNPTTGVAAVMGEAYGSAVQAIDQATNATNDLYNETLKLYTLFGVESAALDEAKKTLIEYRDLLEAATSGSGALATQIEKANQQIVDNAKASGNWITNASAISSTAAGTSNPNAISTVKVSSHVIAGASTSGSGGGISRSSGGISQSGGGSGGGGSVGGSSGEKYNIWKSSTPLIARYSADSTGLHRDLATPGGGWWREFATGGYTGSWSDGGIGEKDGKLAILHQKELVLNAVDTQNILAAVDIVRNITDTLKVASLTNTAHNYNKAQTKDSNDTIEQRVEIIAEFPAANSADEIKQALLGLSDSAMQYAYRER